MTAPDHSGSKGKGQADGWGTRIGVILAVSGSAVGLGNFLRFPGVAVENGGGAFMIPYFIALLVVGIPMSWVEWTIGRYGGARGFHSVPAILGVVGRGATARRFGVLGLLIPLVVYMYYGIIESWCLQYAWGYLSGSMDFSPDPTQHVADAARHFEAISGTNSNGALFSSPLQGPLVFWLIVFVINLALVFRGLSAGIEAFCRIAMPVMAVCALIVLIRVLTLGTPDPSHPERSVINGLGFLWNPEFSRLRDFKTWLAAAGQVFFSLSVGFGVIINYASYLRRSDDVVLSGLTASATNELFEVGFGGLITVTAAFVFLGASGAAGGTFGLGFHTLPVVFLHMGTWGRWIGALWFFMLFLAAITSSLSMLQPLKAFLEEALGMSRARAVTLLGVISGVGSVWVLFFSEDLRALDTMDFWVGTFAIFILATVQMICFGWVLGVDKGLAEAQVGAQMRIPKIVRYLIKYVAPAYLLIVFAGFCIQKLPGSVLEIAQHSVAKATLAFVGLVLVLLLVLLFKGESRWRARGLDLDGKGKGPAT